MDTLKINSFSEENNKNYYRYKFLLFSAILSGAAIPISTAFQNISTLLLLIFVIISPDVWHELRAILKKPFALAGMALGITLLLGTFWTSASPSDAWGFVGKMRAYYLIPIFLLIFMDEKIRSSLLISFAAATFLSVLLSCLSAWFNTPIFKAVPGDWYIFRTHTYQNYFSGLLSIGLLAGLLMNKIPKNWKPLSIICFLLLSYNILFLVSGRTGQLVYLLMLSFILVLWNKKIGLFFCFIIVISSIFILPKYSEVISSGLTNTTSDVKSYSNGDSYSSVGLRLEWHKNSIQIIKENPLFGHGTGSFKTEYAKFLGNGDERLSSENPHNDYLWLSVELGVMGGFLLFILLLSAAWQGRHLEMAWKLTLYAMLMGMGISTLANSFFTDNITGLAFVLLTCALLNGPTNTKKLI